MKDFFECNLFQTQEEDRNIDSFAFKQKELVFKNFTEGNKAIFDHKSVTYQVKFERESISREKVPLILPIRGMPELLDHTLNNLFDNDVDKYTNIIVIDDRTPDIDLIKSVTSKYEGASYMRVNNKKGFNYSMLANTAAYIIYSLGFSEIIYWNSDMWVDSPSTVPALIEKHRKNACTISGTKLVYPTHHWKTGEELSKTHKIQFGGGYLDRHPTNARFEPRHYRRYSEINDPLVTHDCGMLFVTGAYTMIHLPWLMNAGGFNPSLSKVYNDIDICLRASIAGQKVMYFGKDTYLIHGESINLNNSSEPKFDSQFTSDAVLYSKIYPMSLLQNMLGIHV